MIGFWISAVAMVLMVALVLTQALRQARSSQLTPSGREDLLVYRDQLAEVDRDLARGTLPQAEAERLRAEVQRRMLEADKSARADTAPGAKPATRMALAAVVLALGGGAALYWDLGVPGYPDLPLSQRLAAADEAYMGRPNQETAEATAPQMTLPADIDPGLLEMIDQLRAAVAKRPDDLQGHILLAQNEAALTNFVAARKAQEVVVRLKGPDVTAEDLSYLASLMIYAAGGIVTPEAEKILLQCLTMQPTNGWARFYSGLMFAQIGRPDRTFSFWEPLLQQGPADAPWIQPIRDRIEDVAAAAGIGFTLPAAAPGPTAEEMAGAAEMSAEDRLAMIQSMVAGLEERLDREGGTVEEWSRLITSLGVLQEADRARAAFDRARAAFAGKPGELAALQAAAEQAGIGAP